MRIDVHLPGLLQQAIGQTTVPVDAATIGEALSQLRAHPKLRPLIFDETGAIRRHVLVFLNDTATKHLPSPDAALKDGDQITVVQAVSGG